MCRTRFGGAARKAGGLRPWARAVVEVASELSTASRQAGCRAAAVAAAREKRQGREVPSFGGLLGGGLSAGENPAFGFHLPGGDAPC